MSWKNSRAIVGSVVLAACFIWGTGCATHHCDENDGGTSERGSLESRNKQLAIEFMAAISRGDGHAVRDFYTPDGKVVSLGSLPFSGTYTRDELVPVMAGIFQVFPQGLELRILDMTAEGNRVAIEAESYGKTVTGAIYNNHYHFLLIAENGKVKLFKEYMDTKHAYDVLIAPFEKAAPETPTP